MIPTRIRDHLERAWHLASSGRPGPCWLDIPLDVQAAMVDEHRLSRYDPAEDRLEFAAETVREPCAEVLAA
jgi:acetolactate synthase-1/2/3 large subunit